MPFHGIFNTLQQYVEPMQVDIEPNEMDIGELQMEQHNFTVGNPTLDLDIHIAYYSGLMRIRRLLFIAAHAPTLKVEALRMALNYVKLTLNVPLYKDVHGKLVEALSSSSILPDSIAGLVGQIPSIDQSWVDQSLKRGANLLEKLDKDLKNYKANSIKDSIRRGHDDLGNHYLTMGDLSNALKCYSRARDYCMTSKQVVHMCLNVIKISVYLQNWSHVLTHVSKAECTGEKENDASAQKLKCASGLAELTTDKYKLAAKHFLTITLDYGVFSELASPNAIAIYGSLCALATFSREELQKQVIQNSSFKLLLELEPQIREIVFAFYGNRYSQCLRQLNEIKDNLLLDMFLSPHVEKLYTMIRNRAIVQYFSPYMVADMNKMAVAFNCSLPDLENEIIQLILDGQIQARIDSENKILHVRETNHRNLTFEKSLKSGLEYMQSLKALILRAAVLRSNIKVQNVTMDGQEASSSLR